MLLKSNVWKRLLSEWRQPFFLPLWQKTNNDMIEQRHIDLHLPTGWNRCTTEELESIAAAIVEEQAAVGRYRHFLWERVKVHIVLNINRMQVLESDGNGEMFLVQRGDEEPWPINIGQFADLCERLNWLTDEKADKTIFMFPYQTLMLEVRGERLEVSGPPPLLDGYTWREYRWLTDWMQVYMRHANAMAQSKMEDVRRKNADGAAQAQRKFLAVLFKPKALDGKTAEHTSAVSHLTSDIFTDFSPVKWQVILFWWSSLMSMLAKKFPKVFKQQPVGKGKRRPQQQDTPWDFYNRVTATIQKYVGGLSASDVDNQPYGVVLQQLEMMADEAAEMEKLKHKK